MRAAELAGKSADEQVAAYQRAVAATAEYEGGSEAGWLLTLTKLVGDAQGMLPRRWICWARGLVRLVGVRPGSRRRFRSWAVLGLPLEIAGMGESAAKFQTATRQIAANSDTSSAAAANIGKAFLTTSGQSIFSAKEMAEAFAPVSGQLKATEGQALGAAGAMKVMSAAGNLAEGTSSDLTSSTAALAMVMQGYRLPVTEAATASNLLFNTSRALNISLDTVAQSINRLHGRLGDLAPSLGDVGGLMVELGSHGVQGSRGVSVVNTAFQTLVGGSSAVSAMLSALGVNIFNAQGQFIGLQNVIAQCNRRWGS